GGLVAQIPSLLVAVASGLLVTRVASTGDRPLGDDLGEQLGGQPRALAAAAVLLVGLGLVPGLPKAPFLLLGLLAAAFALLSARSRRAPPPTLDEVGASTVKGPRLSLRLSPALHAALAPRSTELHARLAEVRSALAARTGVPLPPLAIARDAELAEAEAAIAIDGTPVAWLSASDLAALVEQLPAALAALVPELIGVDRVHALVERTSAASPILVREVVPRVVSLPVLTEVVRGLVREQVPVEDFGSVLEAIALAPAPTGGFTTRDVPALIENLRGQLRRTISARWAPRGQLAVYTIDGMIEDAVRGAVDRRDGTQVLALEPAIAQDIIAACKGVLGTRPAVILTSGDVRRHLRTLLEPELPDVAVLAAHELSPGTQVQTAGRIEV
ncbi:MAG: FHIPEP family type III secretion protein, partial [Deltaproteobacteria bacterium]|nr:FHIPEP family type III secretion protein [Deltaproteobacteria bacterium]